MAQSLLQNNLKHNHKEDNYINLHGFKAYCNSYKGIAPFLQNEISYRVHKQLACNIAVVGEARLGKSYLGMDLARVHEGLDRKGQDRFTIEQIVYTYQDYMNLTLHLPIGRIVFFDEPSYSIGNRTWQDELQRTLVSTVESSGFKVHPLIIACINLSLIDKKIRNYLIQYLIIMEDRGKGKCYKIQPSQFNSKIYYEYFCEVRYTMLDLDLCNKPSCLGCGDLATCNVFRARYEKRKAETQDRRYEQGMMQAAKIEHKDLTDSQIETLSMNIRELWCKKGKVDVNALLISLHDTYNLDLSITHAYKIRALLEAHHGDELRQTSSETG